jgi:hypothetical protein
MPVSIRLASPDGVDQYQLASGTGWTNFGSWAARLPLRFESVQALYQDGEVRDTLALANQLKQAWDEHRPEDPDVADVLLHLIENLGVGDSDEVAQVVD